MRILQGSIVGRGETQASAGDSCGGKPCWRPIGSVPTGYAYKDRDLSSDGVNRIQLKAGSTGHSTLVVRARSKESADQRDLPSIVARRLLQSTSVKIQLFGSDIPLCFSITLTDLTRAPASPESFRPPRTSSPRIEMPSTVAARLNRSAARTMPSKSVSVSIARG